MSEHQVRNTLCELGPLHLRPPHGRVDDRPEVNQPTHEDEPEQRRQHEHHERHHYPPLHELPEPGNEEAANGRDDVAGGTLTCHGELSGMLHVHGLCIRAPRQIIAAADVTSVARASAIPTATAQSTSNAAALNAW